jgi:hypothetical protein
MVEPISLAAVGGLALTEGIKFLYAQAGEVLKRWRERRDDSPAAPMQEARLRPPEGLLAGTPEAAEPRDELADRLEEELRETRRLLADYADGIETAREVDPAVLERVDALRGLLEVVYGQRITFKGEQRAPSGPLVTAELDVDEVAGRAAGVRAKVIAGGEVDVTVQARRVESGGEVTGVEADRIG